ncbi:MAG TPA: hypothetical protein VKR06_00005, partial [Ktedonosporobacter sp.]|nr:hypothetical protein [Ktedonosporobacter sp.]
MIAPNEITELLVLDSSYREVTHGTSQLTAELNPGIYRVQARLPGARSEQLVAIEPGKTVTLDEFALEFDSPTPLRGIPSTHEYQRDAAYEQSRILHARLGAVPDSRLFLFSRKLNQSSVELPTFVVRGQGLEVRFPDFGEYRPDEGWLALSLALPTGTYSVEQDVPGLGKRGQVLFVEHGWQTQVFAPWEELPNFSKAVIHMRKANIRMVYGPPTAAGEQQPVVDTTTEDLMDFDPNNRTQTALDAPTEAALQGLASG